MNETTGHFTWRDVAAPCACALMISVGYFKGSPLLEKSPYDVTLVLATLLALGIFSYAVSHGLRIKIQPWALVLLLTFAPGWAFFDASNPYQVQNFYGMMLTLLAVIGPCYLLTSERRQKIWVWVLVGIGALYTAGTVVAPSHDSRVGGLTLEGSNTIASGLATGTAFIILFILALLSRGWVRLRYILLGAVFGGGMEGYSD